MPREDERDHGGEASPTESDGDTGSSAMTIGELADRVAALETEVAALDDRVTTNRRDLEEKLAATNRRVTGLEERASVESLELEHQLSQMERYLTGIEDLSPRATASVKRAVALARNWDNIAHAVGGDANREVINLKRDTVIPWVEEAMAAEEGDDITYSPKQIHRSMQKFAELFGDHAEYRKGQNGARELVIEQPDEILWSPTDLDAALQQQTD